MDTSKEKHYNYFYIIVNKVNRKFYYGVHSTDNLDDGYMGSGTVLDAAKKKYGIENFVKTILGFFDTRAEMMEVEREFINPKFLEEHKDTCYNIHLGGFGGHFGHTQETKDYLSKINIGELNPFYGKRHTPETRKKNSEAHLGVQPSVETRKKHSEAVRGEKNPMYGKRHSPESIEKMREAAKHRAPQTEESNKKRSEAVKRYWANKKKQLTA